MGKAVNINGYINIVIVLIKINKPSGIDGFAFVSSTEKSSSGNTFVLRSIGILRAEVVKRKECFTSGRIPSVTESRRDESKHRS